MSRSTLAAGIRHLRSKLAQQCRHEESDEQLLHAFTNHRDDSAFAVLVRRHGSMVLHVCRRVLDHEHDAEDAFQATFLVLARNAPNFHIKTTLAGYLHGIAYRTAMKARQSAARRRKHEGSLGALTQPRSPADPADELSWREVRTLLDEEIARLPEINRSIFVLCCLEELSQAEVSRRCGLPERTVSNRLAAARKLLAQRLARRGVELTAVLAATAVATLPASALPAGLMAKTIQAALATAAGESLAGVVSASVAQLVKSATAAMAVSKTKIATVLLLTASVLAGASVWTYRGLAVNALEPSGSLAEPLAAPVDQNPKADLPQHEAAKTVQIQGRALGSEGKPKAGVKLLWLDEDDKISELGASAADGGFTVSVPTATTKRSQLDNAHPAYLIAEAAGDGIDFIPSSCLKPEKTYELRLVKDNLIRGRIINTEGKPVVGARVGVQSIQIDKNLDTFLTPWMKWHYWAKVPAGLKRLWTRAGTLLAATTDADGCFALSGAGRERYVSLYISGAGIADSQLHVVNRAGFDPRPYNQLVLDKKVPRIRGYRGPDLLYGPDLTFVAEAAKIVRGTVKAADTGKGRPGAAIWSMPLGDDLPLVLLQTKTDAQGRYEIHGLRKAKRYTLQVLRDPAAGYMGGVVQVQDAGGYQPLTADITVKKGVIVTGKLIDRASGKAVPGKVQISVLSGNPFAKDYAEFSHRDGVCIFRVDTGADGWFRDVAIPGQVLLMGRPDHHRLPGGVVEWLSYKDPVDDPKYPQYFRKAPGQFLSYFGLNGSADDVRGACKVLDLKPGTAVVHQDIFMDRESVQHLKPQDAQGQPLRGVWAMGLRPKQWLYFAPSAAWISDDSCPVYGLEAGKPRLMVFYEPARKLAGSRMLRRDENEPIALRLKPAGSVTGRLLDGDGKPLAGLVLDVRYRDEEAAEIHEAIHDGKLIISDARGAFMFNELMPELKLDLSFRRGKRRFEHETKPTEAVIEIKPGEYRDLGAIKLKRVPE